MKEKRHYLFIFTQLGVCRLYLPVLKELAAQGHKLSFFFTGEKPIPGPGRRLEGEEYIQALEDLGPWVQVHQGVLPKRADRWAGLAYRIRIYRDYLRYLHPDYAKAHKLRERLERIVDNPRLLRGIGNWRRLTGEWGVRCLEGGLSFLQRCIPADRSMQHFFRQHSPDAVFFSRLVDPGCPQTEYLRASKSLKIPSYVCIASWDNLTNKGILPLQPDRVFVWNEFQREECVRYHGVAPEKVIATGAQVFDDWFDSRPDYTLDEITKRVGLPRAEPYLLYVCSSSFIAKVEIEFVARWLKVLREKLPDLNVIIRPHPQNAKQWAEHTLPGEGENLAIFPRAGQYVSTDESRVFYSSLLAHCQGIVGINTSAMVEGGIFDKPVFTVLAPEFVLTQEGTIHFSYLIDEGLAIKARDLSEHVEQVARILEGETAEEKSARRAFVAKFLRPRGLNLRATQVFVDELEGLFAAPLMVASKTVEEPA